jgi:hypothetical protein
MSSHTEIMIPQDEFLQIRMGRNPETLIKEAVLCATSLMRVVKENGWAITSAVKRTICGSKRGRFSRPCIA